MNNWPHYEDDVVDAVTTVLRSGKINQWTGTEVTSFEKEFSEYVGTNYAIAVSNGTTALELALYALNIKQGDEVIVTPRTFIASANCVITRGATPVFADVDLNSQNISLETISPYVTAKTKAIITVHLAGMPCDMDPIINFARKNNIYVVEDCAQANGAMYKGRKVGSIGDIGAWSFCQDKIMSTGGEGGMLTLNDEKMYKKAWSYKDHGKDYDLIFNTPKKGNKFRFVHTIPGTNMRMTEMQAAIGRVLLKKLDNWVRIRRRNANILSRELSEIKWLRIPEIPDDFYHSYYKFYVFVEKYDRDQVLTYLNNNRVKCYSGSCSEIYREKAFDNIDLLLKGRFKNAKKLGETSLMFLVHPTITKEEMEEFSLNVKNYLKEVIREK